MKMPIIVVHITGPENQTQNLIVAQQLSLRNALPWYEAIIIAGDLNKQTVNSLFGKINILIDKYEDDADV